MYLKILLSDKKTLRFILGVTFGMAFSIAVILSTIGLMDGFVNVFTEGLRTTGGDISISSKNGFFRLNDRLLESFKKNQVRSYVEVVQSEGFAVLNGKSKGVQLRGIRKDQFNKFSNLSLPSLLDNEIVVGKELANFFNLTEGDELVLTFSNGNTSFKNLPRLERFTIKDTVDLGLYEKNLRTIFINQSLLQSYLRLGDQINLIELKIESELQDAKKEIEERIFSFEDLLGLSCLLYTSPSPRDATLSRMPSSA